MTLTLVILASCALAALVLPFRWILVWGAPLAAVITPIAANLLGGTVASPLNILILVSLIRLAGGKTASQDGGGLSVRQTFALLALSCALLATLLTFGVREGSISSISSLAVGFICAVVVYLIAMPRYGLGLRDVIKPWVMLVLLTSALQLVEVVAGRLVIPESSAFFHSPHRNGEIRAQGLFPHPIVAGVICMTVAVWAIITPRLAFFSRVALVVVALGGSLSTQSRGPLVAGLVGLAVAVLLRWVGKSPSGRRYLLGALVLAGVAVVAFLLSTVATTYIGGSNEAQASANYRLALITSGTAAIAENPFGFGPGQVPAGVLLVDSIYGVLDLSQSIDNGFLLLAFEYGVPTTILLFVFVWAALSGQRSSPDSTAMALLAVLLFTGIFVSITSWAPYTFLLAQVVATGGLSRSTHLYSGAPKQIQACKRTSATR